MHKRNGKRKTVFAPRPLQETLIKPSKQVRITLFIGVCGFSLHPLPSLLFEGEALFPPLDESRAGEGGVGTDSGGRGGRRR